MPDGVFGTVGRLRGLLSQWLLAEVTPGRLIPWVPVAFGAGIAGYFSVDREPAIWAVLPLAIGSFAVAFVARRRPFGFPFAVAMAATFTGFSVATLQTARISHPVLQSSISSVILTGFVEIREERERSDRIVIRVENFAAPNVPAVPQRVRVAVRKGSAPPVGSFVEIKAHLSPPMQPLRPGGYDFARDMYFQKIGASGYALGVVKIRSPPTAGGFWLRYATIIDGIRESIDDRIRALLPGDKGSIASALITGKRDAISTPVNDAMYVSSLAHILSISGYHMAVVSGIVFFVIRATLALIPAFSHRRPIKKWAAFGALLAATFYLLLSGAEIATQRSYIMIAIVLSGVMLDRPTLTFRTLSVAAIVVLLIAPQAIVHPSFQMSFAATLALIAAYQRSLPLTAGRDSQLGARVALWGIREVASLILASLVAGLATTPYAAYHFHRLAPYGVLANLLAMPIVSAIVMPMGILGVLSMPFGFDAPFWQLMGQGIDWMNGVALWVASLPGAVGRMPAFGTGPLLLGTGCLLVICLLRTPLRWSGAVVGAGAVAWALMAPQPDVLVSGDGQTAAFRGADGRLAVLHAGRDTFAVKEWLAADADARAPKDVSLSKGVTCDSIGCIGKLADGRQMSAVLEIEAFVEDCMQAAIVVSEREAPGACNATLIDRAAWQSYGAVTLRWTGDRFARTVALPPGYDRPWIHRARAVSAHAEPQRRQAPREAEPRQDDLAPDD
ncbi:MAG TPA: ComEC/Rec2 family competence protein [Pseudolabrys sp.]|nr:ComEC/Rec2 family competence protein [Pseudolabrys sp.]